MYNSYQNQKAFYNNRQRYNTGYNQNDSRFIGGGFLGPFLLGGLTGGLVAPLFYGGYNSRPYYYNNYYYPCPVYGPYYYR